MSNLEKYLDQVTEQKPTDLEAGQHLRMPQGENLETLPEPGDESMSNLFAGILRRWYIVVIIFFIMCIIGIPVIWLLFEPKYIVAGAIRVAPILPTVLGTMSDNSEISNYENYVNTQAVMVTGNQVVQRVADDLVDKNLLFFKGEPANLIANLKQYFRAVKSKPEPAVILKKAITNRVIKAEPAPRTELISVTMESMKPEEAKLIIDTFIRNYMAIYVSGSIEGEDRKLTVLENERKVLAEKLRSQREMIRQLANEYGTTALDGRQDMMLQRVTTLLDELTRLEARRINLETNIELLEQANVESISTDQFLSAHSEYVNSDPIIQELTRSIVQLERDLVVTKQVLAPGNPAIEQKQELLDAFRSRLEEQRQQLAEDFNNLVAEQTKRAAGGRLLNVKAGVAAIKVHEKRLREALVEQDTQTIELGRKQLNIRDLQFQLELDQQMYDTICRRIQELEMERKRPARISVAYNADIASIKDKRAKFTAALFFGAIACGLGLAFLRNKADKSLWTPDDVTKRIGIRIIGTTASTHNINPATFPEQINGDYQTIRANLGLLDSGGTPQMLVVTSPGVKEGKTTFAVNLATSLARSGKKVLLIDGDFRKPDILYLLDFPETSAGLQDVLSGGEIERAISSVPSSDLDVLAATSQRVYNVYELLTSPIATQQIEKLKNKYEHVIIDTPPILAFPDALVWAKIAGSVILTSFAGQTTAPDLKEAKERLAQINVKVLGTVLSNVPIDQSYYRYGYSYYTRSERDKRLRRVKTNLLLPLQSQKSDTEDSESEEK